jgi:hypothetical protein
VSDPKKDEIAKLCERVWDACWSYALDVVTASADDLERRADEIKQALADYEALRETSGEGDER